MADYRITIRQFFRSMKEMEKNGATGEELVDFVRRNSGRLIVEPSEDIMKMAKELSEGG
jgi:hypothetical protein